jgi:FXSXX-COOH protein
VDTDTGADIPDLRDIPPDRIAALGGTALARAIALYRERLEEDGEPPGAFNSHI